MTSLVRVKRILLLVILVIGGYLRFSGLDWDKGQRLNPDERYISLVLTNLKPPTSWKEYIDPAASSFDSVNLFIGLARNGWIRPDLFTQEKTLNDYSEIFLQAKN